MTGGTEKPVAHGGDRRLAALRGIAQGVAADSAVRAARNGILRVTVVGPDPAHRARLVQILSGVAGLEIVGWAESARTLAVLGSLSGDADGEDAPAPAGRTGPGEDVVRPALSPRQVEVLTAYGAGNDLLDVVARRLGMNAETLKTHLRRIRAKYRQAGRPAPTRRDLYVRAVEDGVLPPPG